MDLHPDLTPPLAQLQCSSTPRDVQVPVVASWTTGELAPAYNDQAASPAFVEGFFGGQRESHFEQGSAIVALHSGRGLMDSAADKRKERYVHGYEEWTRQWMSERTATRDLAFLLPHLRPGMDVIDCGCGPGSITVGLAEIVAPGKVIGVDLETRQLETARAVASERGVANLRFDQASIYELPYPDATFDVAVAHYVIEHVSEPVRALREMCRVLRPGGIAAVKDPYYPAFTFRPALPAMLRYEELASRVRRHNGASDDYAADLRACLLEAGFERTEAAAGILTVAGRDPVTPFFRLIRENQLREPAFRDTVIEQGWATESELDELREDVVEMATRNDLFGFVVFVEALGWVTR